MNDNKENRAMLVMALAPLLFIFYAPAALAHEAP